MCSVSLLRAGWCVPSPTVCPLTVKNPGSPGRARSVHDPPKSLGVFCSLCSSRAHTSCSMAVLGQGFWAPRTKNVLAFVPCCFLGL